VGREVTALNLLKQGREKKADKKIGVFFRSDIMIRRIAQLRFILLGVLVVLVVGAGITIAAMPSILDPLKEWWNGIVEDRSSPKEEVEGAELFYDAQQNAGLRLRPETVEGLEIKPVKAQPATKPRPLPPQIGTVNYDNDRLFTIRSRFAGEVAEVRQVAEPNGQYTPTKLRPLRFGDPVQPGDLLAVVWSQQLGQAKSALVDAISQLNLSEAQLERQKAAYFDAALSLGTLAMTERQVKGDWNNYNSAERSLRMWKLSDDEIKQLKDQAKKILDKNVKRDPKEEAENWARVEIRVPKFPPYIDPKTLNLVVVEKNTNVIDMVDPINSPPLFKIADLSRLQVWVHPPEEYLPILRDRLKDGAARPLKWQIRFQSESPDTPPLELPVLQIAHSLEPNQHTPMVIGYLPNPEGKFLIGQFVTATIFIDPDPDTVEIPTEALNEVEGQALVFVQPDPQKLEYTLRRVAVVRRFKDVTYIRSKLTPEDEKVSESEKPQGRRPIQPLLPGDLVVTRGVVEMTAALEDLVTRERTRK
jgi:cobalt-zinc-cadmium efflux system membrane fusion protein